MNWIWYTQTIATQTHTERSIAAHQFDKYTYTPLAMRKIGTNRRIIMNNDKSAQKGSANARNDIHTTHISMRQSQIQKHKHWNMIDRMNVVMFLCAKWNKWWRWSGKKMAKNYNTTAESEKLCWWLLFCEVSRWFVCSFSQRQSRARVCVCVSIHIHIHMGWMTL